PRAVEDVLLHADGVRMTWPRAGQRGISSDRSPEPFTVRVGRHPLFPLGPLGVADLYGDGPTLGAAVPDPGEQAHLVGLELLPCTATVTEPAARQRRRDVIGGDGHVGRHALQHRSEYGAVGLPGRQ